PLGWAPSGRRRLSDIGAWRASSETIRSSFYRNGASHVLRCSECVCACNVDAGRRRSAAIFTRPDQGCRQPNRGPGETYRRAGAYIGKILGPTNPRDLPIEQPSRFELVVNLKTARALGLTLPSSLVLRADRVVQ